MGSIKTSKIYKWDKYTVKIYESRFPPSPNLDKVTLSFDKLNDTDFNFNSFLNLKLSGAQGFYLK